MPFTPLPFPERDGVNAPLQPRSLKSWDLDRRLVPGLEADRFASSKTTIIASAPARITNTDTEELEARNLAGERAAVFENLTPIGLAQDFSLNQNRGMSEMPEIGSRGIYYMAGNTSRRFTLSKVMFHGASLLRAIYQNSGATFPETNGKALEQLPASHAASLLYINLESRFFGQPTGIFLRFATELGSNAVEAADVLNAGNLIGDLGGIYLEGCYVQAHGLSANANNSLLAENVALTCERVVPIATTTQD